MSDSEDRRQPVADRVLETCLYVDDLEAAKPFYRDVLGLDLLAEEPGRHAFFRCGESMVLLFNPEASSRAHSGSEDTIDVPCHGARGEGHVAFAVEREQLVAWRACFANARIPVEREIAWPGGGHSLYVRDPSNNSVEVATPALWKLKA